MYVPYPNLFIDPTTLYPRIQPPRERPTTNPSMCHYVIKFFECDHKTDDNVKGCKRWEKTGTHCDVDNPAIKKREDCSIRSEKVGGLCPRCQRNERARILREEEEAERLCILREKQEKRKRIEREREEERMRIHREKQAERERIEREHEEELLRRDLEKARLADLEEQRRNAEAHEAHLRRVEEESRVSWEFESKTTTTVQDPSPSPSPLPPPTPVPQTSAPIFPVDYSQPLKEQNYGHYYVGTRRQPIHPSQDLGTNIPLSPKTPTVSRHPQPAVRLAGTVAPSSSSATSSAGGFSKTAGNYKLRPRPSSRTVHQEETVNELQALWNRKGIQREEDEDENEGEDDGITTASITPSESASQASIRHSSTEGRKRRN